MHSHVHLQVSRFEITVYVKVVSCLSVCQHVTAPAEASERPRYFYTGAGCYKVTVFNIGQEEFRAPLNSVTCC